jgi:hypothetical protein
VATPAGEQAELTTASWGAAGDLGVAVAQPVVTAEAAGVELHREDLVGGGLVGEVVEALRVIGDPQESTWVVG